MPTLPPTPRGYQRLEMPLNVEEKTIVLTCHKCGALVLMTGTHDSWHKKNDKR